MTLIVWGVTCAIWSTVWLFIKLGVADIPPITFAAYRLFVYALLYWGMQFVSSGLAAVLQALTPAFAMVFAHVLVARERITGSITGTWLNYWLLKRMDATKVLVMALAEPPIAMMLGAAILDETLSTRMIAGTICILVSVGVILELVPYRQTQSA